MSVPLDRLYSYIESVAQQILRDTVIIYRFSPDGSKKVEDLGVFREHPWVIKDMNPALYCNDQEPLNYMLYQNTDWMGKDIEIKYNIQRTSPNLKIYHYSNIYDKALLLHSEKNSYNVTLYKHGGFIPVYYWSHAIIARDWFRFAEHIEQAKSREGRKTFLIYNRAWTGTREYRLKFIDMLIDAGLTESCKSSVNPVEPTAGLHYSNHEFVNSNFKPSNILENYFDATTATSSYSADFDMDDYNHSDFEVVLETLFDDERNHLTEKILRPIACGHPFLVLGAPGTLQYLRDYGFQTFGHIIDESYDTIKDPVDRMKAVVEVMKTINSWTEQQRLDRIEVMRGILARNKEHFFSQAFWDQVNSELYINLANAFTELETTNTSKEFFTRRKMLKDVIFQIEDETKTRSRRDIGAIVWKARQYYNRANRD